MFLSNVQVMLSVATVRGILLSRLLLLHCYFCCRLFFETCDAVVAVIPVAVLRISAPSGLEFPRSHFQSSTGILGLYSEYIGIIDRIYATGPALADEVWDQKNLSLSFEKCTSSLRRIAPPEAHA